MKDYVPTIYIYMLWGKTLSNIIWERFIFGIKLNLVIICVVNGLDRLVKENNNIFGSTGSEMSRGQLDLFLEV